MLTITGTNEEIQTLLDNNQFYTQKYSPLNCNINFDLTNREMEVLNGMTQGLNNNEIGKSLFISEKTVKNHITNIFEKLKVTNRTLASLKAVKYNLVSLESLNI